MEKIREKGERVSMREYERRGRGINLVRVVR